MTEPEARLEEMNWMDIGSQLDTEGYAVLSGLLGVDAARSLARKLSTSGANRVAMPSGGRGQGESLVFAADLPAPLQAWRALLYRRLRSIANRWNESLGVDYRYPTELEDFLRYNRDAGQTRGQSHISRLGIDDHAPLYQHNEGVLVFPMQIVAVLSEPGADFLGGEFVMTEQRPRMQSRPMVVPMKLGDMAVIARAQRPVQGGNGHYRVSMRHGISRVRQGERIGLELSFHDAP